MVYLITFLSVFLFTCKILILFKTGTFRGRRMIGSWIVLGIYVFLMLWIVTFIIIQRDRTSRMASHLPMIVPRRRLLAQTIHCP